MKQFFNFLVLICGLSFLASCDKEDVVLGNHISFSNMAVGQQSKYALYTSRSPWSDSDTAYKFANDTLILTIIAQNDTGFKVKEELTSHKNALNYYYFKVDGDSLRVKSANGNNVESIVLAGAAKSFILKDNDLATLKANRWGVIQDVNVSKGVGVVSGLKILNENYGNLFAHYNTTPVVYDGQALTELYTLKDGFVSFQALGGFAPLGHIFYILP